MFKTKTFTFNELQYKITIDALKNNLEFIKNNNGSPDSIAEVKYLISLMEGISFNEGR